MEKSKLLENTRKFRETPKGVLTNMYHTTLTKLVQLIHYVQDATKNLNMKLEGKII